MRLLFVLIVLWSRAANADMFSGVQAHFPVPFDSTYVLVFDEEFNGTTLDTTTNWYPAATGHDNTYSNTNETQYSAANLTVHNGCMDEAVTLGPTPDGSAYATAGTHAKVTTVSGQPISNYWEIRAKFANNAYGLASTNSTYVSPTFATPEVDFFEYWQASDPTSFFQDYYYPSCCTPLNGTTSYGSNISSAYHVYGAWWTPAFIRFYVDGVMTQQTTTNVNQNGPVFMAGPVFTAGGGGIYPNGTTVIPNHMYIDYIHVYSNQAGAVAISPESSYGGPGDALGNTTCQ